jgi:hypothetical protein
VNGVNGYRELESAPNSMGQLPGIDIASKVFERYGWHHRSNAITAATAFLGIWIALQGLTQGSSANTAWSMDRG